jgi:hypothetical protein
MISKSSIEAKYRRAGISPQKTWLWVDMPTEKKDELQRYVQLQDDESPIICYFESVEYILLFTMQSIIIIDKGKTDHYPYNVISNVALDEVFGGQKTKQENDIINLYLKSGEMVNLVVEVGTWHVLYNILRLIISQNDAIAL